MPGFIKWETLSLTLENRLEFVRKWFSAVNPGKGESLISRCATRPEILDLGSNPLLLSIVCALYDNDLEIPDDTEELYERAIHGLMGGWDAFRNLARKTPLKELSVERRVTLVTWLANHLFSRDLLVFTPKNIANIGFIEDTSSAIRSSLPSPTVLLKSLCYDFGILVERSPKHFSFSHLSIQEYLVSSFVIENRTERDVLRIHGDKEAWLEIIRLLARRLPRGAVGVFLGDMVTRLNPSNENTRYRMRLLRKAWEAQPLCTKPLRESLMNKLLDNVDSFLSTDQFRLVDKDSEYFLEIPRFPAKTKLLSDIYKILKCSEINMEQLNFEARPILKALIQVDGEVYTTLF